jgi:cytochrome c oxidase subunit 2
MTRTTRLALAAPSLLLLSACAGPQSALDPAGQQAWDVLLLFSVTLVGAALIWLALIGISIYAALSKPNKITERIGNRLVLVGGVILPTIILAALLAFSLPLMPRWQAEPTNLQVHATGEQWWWRVAYQDLPSGLSVGTSNEVHLPAGESVNFSLDTVDVIHSFWIPSLGGKMDMIPGRTNTLRLTPLEPGIYRGVCAEFCGPSHALMAFDVVVHERAEFEEWLAAEAAPARLVAETEPGRILFLNSGCAACHAVRGLSEVGTIGPDLTHLASRRSLAAGILPNTGENLARWIRNPDEIKPDARMPDYAMLSEAEIDALVAFLQSLT